MSDNANNGNKSDNEKQESGKFHCQDKTGWKKVLRNQIKSAKKEKSFGFVRTISDSPFPPLKSGFVCYVTQLVRTEELGFH